MMDAPQIIADSLAELERVIAVTRDEMREDFKRQLGEARRKAFNDGMKAGARTAKADVERRERAAKSVESNLSRLDADLRLRERELDKRERELESKRQKASEAVSTTYTSGFAEGAALASRRCNSK